MSAIKQRIVQAAVDNNVWLVSQLVDELEARHEAEIMKFRETTLIAARSEVNINTLADLYKSLQQNTYIMPETICMEGENQFNDVKYQPCCKHGYNDCIWDPAYIYATYPEWYKRLYRNKLPTEITCEHCENGERWDDEDK